MTCPPMIPLRTAACQRGNTGCGRGDQLDQPICVALAATCLIREASASAMREEEGCGFRQECEGFGFQRCELSRNARKLESRRSRGHAKASARARGQRADYSRRSRGRATRASGRRVRGDRGRAGSAAHALPGAARRRLTPPRAPRRGRGSRTASSRTAARGFREAVGGGA